MGNNGCKYGLIVGWVRMRLVPGNGPAGWIWLKAPIWISFATFKLKKKKYVVENILWWNERKKCMIMIIILPRGAVEELHIDPESDMLGRVQTR